MRRASILAGVFLFFAISLQAADGSKVFDVRQFGAKGDGKTPRHRRHSKSAGRLWPGRWRHGEIFAGNLSEPAAHPPHQNHGAARSGRDAAGCTGCNQDFLQGAAGDWLKAKRGADFVPFISGKDLTDVTFTGQGTIDGNGAVWWEEAEKARRKVSGYTLPRPNLIVLTRCKNVRLENLTLQNSPKFHFVPDRLRRSCCFQCNHSCAGTRREHGCD